MIIFDTECYQNYWLIMFKEIESGIITHSEVHPGQKINKVGITTLMENYTTISFNGLSYDLPMLTAALQGWSNKSLKKLSDKIIKSNRPSYIICQQNNIDVPIKQWDHIDLMEVSPGFVSLKLYGCRMGAPKLQDLPIAPDEQIAPEMREKLRLYCKNDLDTTEMLYKTLLPQIKLRESMSKQYGIDLRSKSDAQIAETVIKSEMKKITGRRYTKPKEQEGRTVRYQNPMIVTLDNPELQDIFKGLLKHDFDFAGNGKINLPPWLKDNSIKIGNAEYNMGVGGLHSCEKSQLVRANGGLLLEYDVRSYYPSILLQQKLAPKSMGKNFLDLYQSLVTRRLEAKASGDTVTANTFKIILNGSYGKLGSKYSALYAPELLLQTTITGQLCLLMLIERMENAGISIVSANTDGVVCHASKELEREMEIVAWNWMVDTSYMLERTDYELLASRDVNSYFAIKSDGKIKRKGIFNKNGLMKNPDRSIIHTAVVEFLKNEVPISETIRACKDIKQFLTARKAAGGATWNGEDIGKTVRFYSSNETFFIDPAIHYKLNGNKVPKSGGCRPLMELGEGMPDDLDYEAYESDAEKLLLEVGYETNG